MPGTELEMGQFRDALKEEAKVAENKARLAAQVQAAEAELEHARSREATTKKVEVKLLPAEEARRDRRARRSEARRGVTKQALEADLADLEAELARVRIAHDAAKTKVEEFQEYVVIRLVYQRGQDALASFVHLDSLKAEAPLDVECAFLEARRPLMRRLEPGVIALQNPAGPLRDDVLKQLHRLPKLHDDFLVPLQRAIEDMETRLVVDQTTAEVRLDSANCVVRQVLITEWNRHKRRIAEGRCEPGSDEESTWASLAAASKACDDAKKAFELQWDENAKAYEAYHRLRALRAHLRVPFQALGRVPNELCPEDLVITLENVKRYFE